MRIAVELPLPNYHLAIAIIMNITTTILRFKWSGVECCKPFGKNDFSLLIFQARVRKQKWLVEAGADKLNSVYEYLFINLVSFLILILIFFSENMNMLALYSAPLLLSPPANHDLFFLFFFQLHKIKMNGILLLFCFSENRRRRNANRLELKEQWYR